MDVRRALFAEFIDYAGLFPPAQLDMQAAVEEYGVLRAGARAWMLGRFIVPASRAFELCEQLEELAEDGAVQPYPLNVIVDAGSDSRSWLTGAGNALASVVRTQVEGLPVYPAALELPRDRQEVPLPAFETLRLRRCPPP
ncbi:MAG: hypothetical protein NVS9B12_11090 [Vulcanimicrobiaceae bacterium]